MPDLPLSIVVFLVIGAGAILALVSRAVLRESRSLAWSTTIVAAVLGAAIAWLPLDLLGVPPGGLVRLGAGLIGAVAAVAAATTYLVAQQRRRTRGVAGASVRELIARGEGERVELKATARWNTKTGAKDARMEEEVLVTVAGFLNAAGGTLLIGVDDDGAIHGLDEDYAVVPGRDRDGFELWLRTLMGERLGRAVTADVGVSFEAIDGKDVCRVDVAPAERPVFLGTGGGARTADFHLRVGNATRRLLTDEVLDYQRRRWP
ncbi:MAG: ATP-binding protein [Chloroflexota bacterium]